MRRAMRLSMLLASCLALSACELFDDKDWREGTESAEDCAARLAKSGAARSLDDFHREGTLWVPTYTFDVTKLDLETIQELSKSNSDETEGTRLNQTTNLTSTAVDQFMQQSVDENGSFFLGRDPSLYRVRGKRQPLHQIIASGCERQREGMRLIDFSFDSAGTAATQTDTDEPQEDQGN